MNNKKKLKNTKVKSVLRLDRFSFLILFDMLYLYDISTDDYNNQ